MNDILADAESEIRRSFLTEIGQHIDDEVGPLVHLVSAWNIDKARDLAWVSAETIWATQTADPALRLGTSRCSATPSAWPRGACSPPSDAGSRRARSGA